MSTDGFLKVQDSTCLAHIVGLHEYLLSEQVNWEVNE